MPRLTNKNKLIQQIALRLLVDAKAFKTVHNLPWNNIEDTFDLVAINLSEYNSKLIDKDTRAAYSFLKAKHTQVFSKSVQLTLPTSKFGNWLKSHCNLSTIAYQIVMVLQLLQSEERLAEIVNSFGELDDIQIIAILSTIIACKPIDIANEFEKSNKLYKYKLIRNKHKPAQFTHRLRTAEIVETHLFNPYYKNDSLLSSCLSKVNTPELQMNSFRLMARDVQWVNALLASYKNTQRAGCNILLYGPPGTGKTQLSRVLAKENGLNCLEVNFANTMGEQLSGEERLNKLNFSQHFLDKNSVIVFDEMEDAIPMDSIFDTNRGPQKRWFNEILETNPVPIIWITNEIKQLDQAFLRRFDYCLAMSHQSYRYKKNMIKQLLNVDDQQTWVDEVAKHKSISVADIERAANVITATTINSDKQKAHYFKSMMKTRGASNLTRRSKRMKNNTNEYVSETEFSTRFSNTNIPLDEITNIVKNAEEGRFLLHGTPGTGKTGYVHHLAKLLNKPLISKSASDLLGKFVGENEKSIRGMFDEANANNAILLLDEADNFFSDRANQSSDWKMSLVNEMLVQLERYQGIFFASTNLPEMLDKAITRRFDFCIAFNFLTKPQIREMIESTLLKEQFIDDKLINELDQITPADFSIAARQARLRGEAISFESLMPVLREQSKMREAPTRTIGFI